MRRTRAVAVVIAVLLALLASCVGGPGPSSTCDRLAALEPDISALPARPTVGAARSTLERARVLLDGIGLEPSIEGPLRRLDAVVDEAWIAMHSASDDDPLSGVPGVDDAAARLEARLGAVLRRCG